MSVSSLASIRILHAFTYLFMTIPQSCLFSLVFSLLLLLPIELPDARTVWQISLVARPKRRQSEALSLYLCTRNLSVERGERLKQEKKGRKEDATENAETAMTQSDQPLVSLPSRNKKGNQRRQIPEKLNTKNDVVDQAHTHIVYSTIGSYRGPAWLLIDPPLGTPTTSIHTKLFHRLSKYRLFRLRDFPQEPSEALLNEQCLNGAKDHGKIF